MKKVLVINGANLNFLGIREKGIYGEESLEQINEKLGEYGKNQGIELEFFQSNHEGEIVDKIQAAFNKKDFLIINPGAFTHYSIAIRDAVLSIGIGCIEVHLSNIYKREEFRHKSLMSDISIGTITGFGSYGYKMALDYIINMEKAR